MDRIPGKFLINSPHYSVSRDLFVSGMVHWLASIDGMNQLAVTLDLSDC